MEADKEPPGEWLACFVEKMNGKSEEGMFQRTCSGLLQGLFLIGKFWTGFHFPVLIALMSAVITLGFGVVAFEVLTNERAAFPGIFSRWDASHYEVIATHGYAATAERGFHICFFPLFPLLAAPLVLLLGNSTLALLLVANFFCVIAFAVFYRLAEFEFDGEVAKIGVVSLALFPTAYFFHLGYTESLFLAATVAAFLSARKGAWAWAGFFAFAAALTRMTGLALVPALLVEYLQQRDFRIRQMRPSILCVFTPLLGIALYTVLNACVFGDPLRFLSMQAEVFSKRLDWPWVGFLGDWEGLATADPTTRIMICCAHLAAFVLATGFFVWSVWRLRPCYSVYLGALWVLTFCYSFWMSLPRFLLGMFPIFFLAALVLRRRPLVQFFAGFAGTLFYGLGLLQFVRGWWAH